MKKYFNLNILFVLIFISFNTEYSQNKQDKGISEAKKYSPIPILEIPRRSNESIIQLRKMRLKVKAIYKIVEVKIKIDQFKTNFQRIIDFSELDRLNSLSYADIGGIRKNWILYQSIIENWQTILEKRMEELDEERQNVFDIKEQWEVTKDNADTLYLSKKIYNIIDTVLSEASVVDSVIKNRESFVLALFSQSSEYSLKVAEIIEKIETAEEDASIRLFTKDEASIWEKSFLESSLMPDKLVVNQWSRFLLAGSFQTISFPRFFLQLIFLIFLIILFKNQKKRSHINQGDEKSEYTEEITWFLFSRPYAAAFFIILFLSFLFSNSYMPFLNLELAIPAIRILPAIKGRRYFRQLYFFMFVYIYYLVIELSLKSFPIERLNLIIIPLIMIIILIVPLKSSLSIKKNHSLKERLLTYVYLVPVILFIFVFFTNLLGYFYLSQLFNTATLNSTFTGVILFIAVLIIEKTFLPVFKNKSIESIKILRRAIKIWEERWGNLIKLAAVILWIVFVLSEFGVYKFAANWITEAIEHKWIFGAVEFTLGDILFFSLTFIVSILIAKLLRFLLEEDVLSRMKLSPGVAFSVSTIVYYIILLLGFFLAVSSAGVDLNKFTILMGALGVGIGFGLQNVVSNFISGLIMIFERPLKVGDIIEVGSLSGKVQKIGIRASSLKTFDGAEVIVPNGTLISTELVNWTRTDQLRRIEILIGVAYGTKPDTVIEILKKIPLNHHDVVKNKPPVVLFKGFGESSLDFSLRFWTSNFNQWMELQSDITKEVNDALAAAGIEIPFPQRDIHIIPDKPLINNIKSKEPET